MTRKHIHRAALIAVALAYLFIGSNALGQGLQPPFMAPTPPSLTYGAFYFQAGVKYRNVDSFRFDVSGASNTIVVDPGTVPFGPTTAGNFGVGTGKDGFLGIFDPHPSWIYDNGEIDATPTPPGIHIAGGPGVDCSVTAGLDQVWPPPPTFSNILYPDLGRYVTTSNNADSSCAGLAIPLERGSFAIDDPSSQVNNLGSIAGTTAVTFSVAVPGSLTFATNTTPDINRVVDSNVWGPSFEFGYQWSNFFDLFYGFSWFNVSNSIGLSNTIQGQAGHSVIQDTFPFLSDDTSAWPVFAFRSSTSVVGTTPAHNYQIAPNSSAQGVTPNRQFLSQTDASIPIENIQENIFTSAEFTPLENRFGARSWAPLYGLGRLGATLGTAVIPTHFKISGSSSYIASGSSGLVDPGTVLAGQVSDHNNWTTLYGLFVGGDLSMGNTGYFLYASADYMWATNFHYDLGTVTTTFNPGGFTGTLSAGVQF
ncbi:MAG: hypothetical protein ACLP5H_22240 [Desulfomonilaceae bacterium]